MTTVRDKPTTDTPPADAQAAPVQPVPAQPQPVAPQPARTPRELRGEEMCVILHDLWTPGYSLIIAPRAALAAQDMKARYVKLKSIFRFLIAPIGAFAVGGPTFLVSAFLVLFGVLDGYMWPSIIGACIGFVGGVWFVSRMKSKAIWVFRLKRFVDKKTGEITEWLEPVVPRTLLQDYRVVQNEKKLPMVMRASYVGKMVLQADVRRFVRSKMGKHKMLQIGAILLFAIAMVIILVFANIATSGPEQAAGG